MIEAGQVFAGLQKAASTGSTHASTTLLPKADENHLMNIVERVR
jgi:hypothetical protein